MKLEKAHKISRGFGEKDQLFSLGTGSLVPKLVEDFEQVIPRVKEKLETAPTRANCRNGAPLSWKSWNSRKF